MLRLPWVGEHSLGPLLLAFHIHSLLPRASPSSDPRDPPRSVYSTLTSLQFSSYVSTCHSQIWHQPPPHMWRGRNRNVWKSLCSSADRDGDSDLFFSIFLKSNLTASNKMDQCDFQFYFLFSLKSPNIRKIKKQRAPRNANSMWQKLSLASTLLFS